MKTLQKEKQIKFKLPEEGVIECPKVTVEGFTSKVKQGSGKLELMHGDIAEYPVDILVNAATADLQHGGGLAGQTSRRGGPEIQAESSKYIHECGRLREGDAVLLHAKGILSCKAIIHAVGPRWAEGRANEDTAERDSNYI